MKTFIDWCKWKILGIALMRHAIVLTWRVHKNQTDIFADRPLWVVKILGYKRLSPSDAEEIDSDERTHAGLYNLSNQAVKELAKRQARNVE